MRRCRGVEDIEDAVQVRVQGVDDTEGSISIDMQAGAEGFACREVLRTMPLYAGRGIPSRWLCRSHLNTDRRGQQADVAVKHTMFGWRGHLGTVLAMIKSDEGLNRNWSMI